MFKKLLRKIKNEIVQEVPSELEECLVCGKSKCSSEEWIKCENRIEHMRKKTHIGSAKRNLKIRLDFNFLLDVPSL